MGQTLLAGHTEEIHCISHSLSYTLQVLNYYDIMIIFSNYMYNMIIHVVTSGNIICWLYK